MIKPLTELPKCRGCIYELPDQLDGGADPDCSVCIACDDGDNFFDIDWGGGCAIPTGRGTFLAG